MVIQRSSYFQVTGTTFILIYHQLKTTRQILRREVRKIFDERKILMKAVNFKILFLQFWNTGV